MPKSGHPPRWHKFKLIWYYSTASNMEFLILFKPTGNSILHCIYNGCFVFANSVGMFWEPEWCMEDAVDMDQIWLPSHTERGKGEEEERKDKSDYQNARLSQKGVPNHFKHRQEVQAQNRKCNHGDHTHDS